MWLRRDTPPSGPRPPSASLQALGESPHPSPRATCPPRPHRFLNHRRSIYWEQINSPFWKRFNCWLDGWGADAGGRAGPWGARGKGLVGRQGAERPSATRPSSLQSSAWGRPPPVPQRFGLRRRPASWRVPLVLLWRPAPSGVRAGRTSAPSPSALLTSRQVGPAFGCLWTVPVQARDPARVEGPGPTERGLPGLPAQAADAAASSPLGRTRPSCPRPLGPPPLPGQGCGQASCCLIFSAIPFARLYLTRPTPPRRSLGHRILHIAAWARLPCLRGSSSRGRLENPCLRNLDISGAWRGQDWERDLVLGAVATAPAVHWVGIPPCVGEGRKGQDESCGKDSLRGVLCPFLTYA